MRQARERALIEGWERVSVLVLTACVAACLSGCVVVTARSAASASPTPAVAGATALDAKPSVSALVGSWRVDLRPTPDAPPYYQSFVIASVETGRFTGSFSGAPISEGRINLDWGAHRIAFVTGDASTSYYHSAVLRDGRLEGLTRAPGRGFLAFWTAEQEKR